MRQPEIPPTIEEMAMLAITFPSPEMLHTEPPHQRHLDFFKQEVGDDPNLSLSDLTDTERERLRFNFVPCAHNAFHAPAITEAVGEVDYYIMEGVAPNHVDGAMRAGCDIAINMNAQGMPVAFRLPITATFNGQIMQLVHCTRALLS